MKTCLDPLSYFWNVYFEVVMNDVVPSLAGEALGSAVMTIGVVSIEPICEQDACGERQRTPRTRAVECLAREIKREERDARQSEYG